jgi:Icc-related predicted phosphoesterase
MKLQIMSDLHLEGGVASMFTNFKPVGDVLILAGDITSARNLSLVDQVFGNLDIPVLYVMGNHEYYRGDYEQTLENFRQWFSIEPRKIQLLENDSVVINGVRFIGSTYWSDPSPMYEAAIQFSINDFRVIGGFTMEKLRTANKVAKSFIKETLVQSRANGDVRKNVVITHFAPSMKAQDPKHGSSALGTYFCNVNEDILELEKPDLWIYGHTHDNLRFNVHNTPVVCNQQGYFGEYTNKTFDLNYVVEI